MTQNEIIEMAKQAGLYVASDEWNWLEAFAKLVEEKATEKANARANASWTLMCEKMVAFEREACAKLCDELSDKHTWEGCYAAECAGAIRARGEA
jgi:hypothetical protein